MNKVSGLTKKEEIVEKNLLKAWSAFKDLPVQHPSDENDFAFGIHICQGLLMQRIARRAFPDGWKNEEKK